MKIKLAIGLIVLGIVSYKVMVDYFHSASWPGLLMILIGSLYIASDSLKKQLRSSKSDVKTDKTGAVGAGLVLIGLLSLTGLVFLQESYWSFYVIYCSVPLIVIGVILTGVAQLRKRRR